MRQVEQFTTARLVARDWTPADLDAAFSIYGRDEVCAGSAAGRGGR
jgi:hypothetical protein